MIQKGKSWIRFPGKTSELDEFKEQLDTFEDIMVALKVTSQKFNVLSFLIINVSFVNLKSQVSVSYYNTL